MISVPSREAALAPARGDKLHVVQRMRAGRMGLRSFKQLHRCQGQLVWVMAESTPPCKALKEEGCHLHDVFHWTGRFWLRERPQKELASAWRLKDSPPPTGRFLSWLFVLWMQASMQLACDVHARLFSGPTSGSRFDGGSCLCKSGGAGRAGSLEGARGTGLLVRLQQLHALEVIQLPSHLEAVLLGARAPGAAGLDLGLAFVCLPPPCLTCGGVVVCSRKAGPSVIECCPCWCWPNMHGPW